MSTIATSVSAPPAPGQAVLQLKFDGASYGVATAGRIGPHAGFGTAGAAMTWAQTYVHSMIRSINASTYGGGLGQGLVIEKAGSRFQIYAAAMPDNQLGQPLDLALTADTSGREATSWVPTPGSTVVAVVDGDDSSIPKASAPAPQPDGSVAGLAPATGTDPASAIPAPLTKYAPASGWHLGCTLGGDAAVVTALSSFAVARRPHGAMFWTGVGASILGAGLLTCTQTFVH